MEKHCSRILKGFLCKWPLSQRKKCNSRYIIRNHIVKWSAVILCWNWIWRKMSTKPSCLLFACAVQRVKCIAEVNHTTLPISVHCTKYIFLKAPGEQALISHRGGLHSFCWYNAMHTCTQATTYSQPEQCWSSEHCCCDCLQPGSLHYGGWGCK